MRRKSQPESTKIAHERVLARVLSRPGGLRTVRGASLSSPFDGILTATASLLGFDYSSPNYEGDSTF